VRLQLRGNIKGRTSHSVERCILVFIDLPSFLFLSEVVFVRFRSCKISALILVKQDRLVHVVYVVDKASSLCALMCKYVAYVFACMRACSC
jgi:hypothetical protein